MRWDLFEICRGIDEIVNAVTNVTDPVTGEVTEADFDIDAKLLMLQELEMEKAEKTRQLVMAAKNLQSAIDAIDKILKEWSSRLGTLKKRLKAVNDMLLFVTGGDKYTCTEGTVSWRRTMSTPVDEKTFLAWAMEDEDRLTQLTRHKESWEPDKKAIAKALEQGFEIPGCTRQENYNIKIG